MKFLSALLLLLPLALHAQPAKTEGGDIPPSFTPPTDRADFVKREAMIPMRDGARLYTVIWIPRGAHDAPILLTRTPYNAGERFAHSGTTSISAAIGDGDVADELVARDGYIRVLQDVRGKFRSEGEYVMTRPLIGPLNATTVDHSTDTYDTIDWLVKNVPESNGRVGILGISYDGFTSLMALFHPHPALRAAVPINPMVDGWMGDDWFHNGAFRQDGTLQYIAGQEGARGEGPDWESDSFDSYTSFLEAGSAGAMAGLHSVDKLGFWRKLSAHPAYDEFWQNQAIDKLLAREKLTVPTMLVHSLWDQEDIYGASAVWRAVKPHDDKGLLHLVLGPWFHHQARLDGSTLGPLHFGSDTALFFREHILKPFLDENLKGLPAPQGSVPVMAFLTGANHWERLGGWPSGCMIGCTIGVQKFYLEPDQKAGFDPAPAGAPGYARYMSDPAHPVPFIPRPVHTAGDDEARWQTWLAQDQREPGSRPDVLTFMGDILREPVRLSGQPVANLRAAISGQDVDFVVKLIDVYPEEYGRPPSMGGFQLMVSGDILRGRYREDFAHPKPATPGQEATYRFTLPTVNHLFLPGHRIAVQIQSSWFPLYDRNPQSWVNNILFAKPTDFKAEQVDVFDSGPDSSFLELPVVQHQGTPNP